MTLIDIKAFGPSRLFTIHVEGELLGIADRTEIEELAASGVLPDGATFEAA